MAIYEHHVIISYRRIAPWESWVRHIFAPTLKSFLDLEFTTPTSVYVDDQIVTGADWEYSLNQAIDRSRIMVPVFINPYFDSDPCRKEMARMLHREEHLGLRTATCPEGLIYPIRLSSRHYFPDLACRIQDEDFTAFALPNLAANTITRERFETSVQLFANKLATAIRNVPSYDPAWEALDGTHLIQHLSPKELDIFQPPRITP